MINVENYLSNLIALLKAAFGKKLLYVGLQGSYLRGEASENSDIDIMVIIDNLCVADLDQYRAIIQSLDHYEKSCGFICSRADLACWNPLEICHLLNSTKDYFGTLKDFVPLYTDYDTRNFIRLSVNNLYHEICHRYIHASSTENIANLPLSYKGVFFILQNLYYLRTGKYIVAKTDLLPLLTDKDQHVLEASIILNQGYDYNFSQYFELLFAWCQETLQSIS